MQLILFDPERGITIRLAPDSTGMKHGNRGEWLRVKWNVKRRAFKLHILAEIDARGILAFSITDMNGGDAGQLPTARHGATTVCGGGISLPLSITDVVLDAVGTARGDRHTDRHQMLLDDWMYDDKVGRDERNAAGGAALAHVRQRLETSDITAEVRGDGAYDKHGLFALLRKLDMMPIIKIRKNANAFVDNLLIPEL